MAKIAYILLCHKDPDAIIRQADRLTTTGDYMSIHFDANAKPEDYERIRKELSGNANVTFAKKRVKCGWGEWSLVQATLNAVEAAVDAYPRATHFYMLSGDCMAIKSAQYMHAYLDANDTAYQEYFQWRRKYKLVSVGPVTMNISHTEGKTTKMLSVTRPAESAGRPRARCSSTFTLYMSKLSRTHTPWTSDQ